MQQPGVVESEREVEGLVGELQSTLKKNDSDTIPNMAAAARASSSCAIASSSC